MDKDGWKTSRRSLHLSGALVEVRPQLWIPWRPARDLRQVLARDILLSIAENSVEPLLRGRGSRCQMPGMKKVRGKGGEFHPDSVCGNMHACVCVCVRAHICVMTEFLAR